MKKIILLILFLYSFHAFADFSDYFYPKTLRVDYYHTGNEKMDMYSIDEMIEESYWGGSMKNLIDTFNYGNYKAEVFDLESGKLIYSRGYSSLFYEWKFTKEAKYITKTFTETFVMPYPKKDIRLVFNSRDSKGNFVSSFEFKIKADNYFIKKDSKNESAVFKVLNNGDPAKKVDIVLLPEGYTKSEMKLFKEDCEKFAKYLFEFSPYSENKEKFNINAVLAPSAESGTDIPKDNIWKQTILGTSFYTFDNERYLMTTDNKSVRDYASNVAYDQIYILVNTTKYGGGAIFNHYATSVNSNFMAKYIFVHEFGHSFAGLGDEYYTSDVAYTNIFDLGIETWRPNLTTLVDFGKKWKYLISEDTPIPTPDILKYRNSTGVFEGGGYQAKGIYRPAHNCLMKSFDTDEFCEVCKISIQQMIDFYSE